MMASTAPTLSPTPTRASGKAPRVSMQSMTRLPFPQIPPPLLLSHLVHRVSWTIYRTLKEIQRSSHHLSPGPQDDGVQCSSDAIKLHSIPLPEADEDNASMAFDRLCPSSDRRYEFELLTGLERISGSHTGVTDDGRVIGGIGTSSDKHQREPSPRFVIKSIPYTMILLGLTGSSSDQPLVSPLPPTQSRPAATQDAFLAACQRFLPMLLERTFRLESISRQRDGRDDDMPLAEPTRASGLEDDPSLAGATAMGVEPILAYPPTPSALATRPPGTGKRRHAPDSEMDRPCEQQLKRMRRELSRPSDPLRDAIDNTKLDKGDRIKSYPETRLFRDHIVPERTEANVTVVMDMMSRQAWGPVRIRSESADKFASPCSDREPLPGSPACNNGFERATQYDEPILVKRTEVEDKDRPLGCRIGSLERLGGHIDETAWKVIRDVEEWPREIFQAQDSWAQKLRKMSRVKLSEHFQSTFRLDVMPPRPINVLSNEASEFDFSKGISPPEWIRKNDFACALGGDGDVGQVKFVNYADRGCITPFHYDSSGGNNMIWLLSGEKVFYLLKPEEERIYRCGISRSLLPSRPFPSPDEFKDVIRVRMKPGDALLLPSGWLHAVVTTKPSVVWSSSFYTYGQLSRQIHLYRLDLETAPDKVDADFCWLHYLAAESILSTLEASSDAVQTSMRIELVIRQLGLRDLVAIYDVASLVWDNVDVIVEKSGIMTGRVDGKPSAVTAAHVREMVCRLRDLVDSYRTDVT